MHFRWFHGFHVHVAPIVDPVDEEAVRETWWKVVKSGVVNPNKNERFGVPQAFREKEQQGKTLLQFTMKKVDENGHRWH